MAIKQTNIFPIDQQPRNAVGLSYPFTTFATSGSVPFKLNYTTQEQIKANLTIFFTTNLGERPLNPNYGGGLKDILFEQLNSNTFDLVKKRIVDNLSLFFPEVKLRNLEVLEDVNNNTLKVVMSYNVFNNNEDTIEINYNL
jgi:phage baseplate assembly protein W